MYLIHFYLQNSQNLPTGHPATLNQFNPPPYIEGSGYYLNNQTYYTGELTSSYINENKNLFGIGDGAKVFTETEYHNYLGECMPLYEEWRGSLKNPQNKIDKIKEIKVKAQDKIVTSMGMDPADSLAWIVKQLNYIAKGAQLSRKESKGVITPQESGLLEQLEGFFQKVEAIRAHSNLLEAQANSGVYPDLNSWPV